MSESESAIHLALYGRVGWRTGPRFEVVPPGKPASIVVALAGARGRFVPAHSLLDQLWSEPPRSGLNALQRHVSRLRAHLRSAGIDPDVVIESNGSGYRLSPSVTTDLGFIEAAVDDGEALPNPTTGDSPCWWLEPLIGVSHDAQPVLRALLSSWASRACRRWAHDGIVAGHGHEVATSLDDYLHIHRHDEAVWSLQLEAALSTGDAALIAAVDDAVIAARRDLDLESPRLHSRAVSNRPDDGPVEQDPSEYRRLRGCAARWTEGDADAAFAELDAVASHLPADVVRRMARCLVWLQPDDGYARAEFLELTTSAVAMPEQSERAVVTLDAYALEQMVDGLVIADCEVDAAETVAELVRAIRVRFMVGLGHPIKADQRALIDRLASIDHADAEVEAVRFAALLAVKSGCFDAAVELFDRYGRIVRRRWPRAMDDFQQLAMVVLGLAVSVDLPLDRDLAWALVPIFTNQLTVDMATLWERLERGELVDDQVMRFKLQWSMSTVPPDCAAAYDLYWRLRVEGVGPTETLAADLADMIEQRPRHRYRHGAIAAVAHWAIESGDSSMAERVLTVLRPWSGEYLGLWPLDTVIGPADSLIADLEHV